jgi:cytochrome c
MTSTPAPRILLAASGLAALLAACAAGPTEQGPPPAPPPPQAAAVMSSAERGHFLVRRDCSGCHAVEVAGASPFGAAPPFRTLHERYPLEDLEEALTEGIMSGHPAMPEFEYSAGEAADIVAWLKSLDAK